MNQSSFIRKAEPKDAPFVARLFVQAMGDLAIFFTSNSGKAEELKLFELFFRKTGNQYSYENTIVFELNGKVIGSLNGYDGGRLGELRDPFFSYIQTAYNVHFPVSDEETEPGEFYIDCVSVSPWYRGKGIGTLLLKSMIEKGARLKFQKIGLLVDYRNEGAKKLYTNLGFQKVDDKSFMGGRYDHLQLEIIG
jgi:ribosomal protein S18 acetylase RimI-like enzyme